VLTDVDAPSPRAMHRLWSVGKAPGAGMTPPPRGWSEQVIPPPLGTTEVVPGAGCHPYRRRKWVAPDDSPRNGDPVAAQGETISTSHRGFGHPRTDEALLPDRYRPVPAWAGCRSRRRALPSMPPALAVRSAPACVPTHRRVVSHDQRRTRAAGLRLHPCRGTG
jgi:hypothetical protein